MGDSAIWSGRLEFEPAMRWGQYRELLARQGESSLLKLVEDTGPLENRPEGTLTRRMAIGLTPRHSGRQWGKAAYLSDALAPWLELARQHDVEIRGTLFTDGDLAPTRHWVGTDPDGRYVLKSEVAVVAWPDGTSAYEREGPDGFYRIGEGGMVFDGQAAKGVQPG